MLGETSILVTTSSKFISGVNTINASLYNPAAVELKCQAGLKYL
jgi:hypothetical protein